MPYNPFFPFGKIGVVFQPRLEFTLQKLAELRIVLDDVVGCLLLFAQVRKHRRAGRAFLFEFLYLYGIGSVPLLVTDLAADGSHLIDLRIHPDDIVLNILRRLQMLLTDQRHLIGVPVQLPAFRRQRLLILLFVHRSDTEHDGNTPEETDITGHAGCAEIKIPLAVIHFRWRMSSCVFLCLGLQKLKISLCYPVVLLVLKQSVLHAFLVVLVSEPKGADAFL